jgi:hypothetical protein
LPLFKHPPPEKNETVLFIGSQWGMVKYHGDPDFDPEKMQML